MGILDCIRTKNERNPFNGTEKRRNMFKYGRQSALTASEALDDLKKCNTEFDAFAFEPVTPSLVEKGVEPHVDKMKGVCYFYFSLSQVFKVTMLRPLWRTSMIKLWMFEIDDMAYSAMRLVDQSEKMNRKFLFHNLGSRVEKKISGPGIVLANSKTCECWALVELDLEVALDLEDNNDLGPFEDLRKRVPWLDITLTDPLKIQNGKKKGTSPALPLPPLPHSTYHKEIGEKDKDIFSEKTPSVAPKESRSYYAGPATEREGSVIDQKSNFSP